MRRQGCKAEQNRLHQSCIAFSIQRIIRFLTAGGKREGCRRLDKENIVKWVCLSG